MTADIREIDRRAVLASAELVSKASIDDLDLATPCVGWTLGDLLAHMTVQHYGFAAAARGHGADLEVWRVRPLGDLAGSAYAEATEHVIAAFAEDGVLEREFVLPSSTMSCTAGTWHAHSASPTPPTPAFWWPRYRSPRPSRTARSGTNPAAHSGQGCPSPAAPALWTRSWHYSAAVRAGRMKSRPDSR
jgi:hypothetical protein